MRLLLSATLIGLVTGCSSVPTPAPITRDEIAAKVDCAKLDAGVSCPCVIDKATAAAPNVNLRVIGETPGNAAQSQAITRQLRIGLAIGEGEKLCAPAAGSN